MDFIYINVVVRRADGQKIDQKDLEDFAAFWREHYNPGRYNGSMPELLNNRCEIYADYNNYATFDAQDAVEFAKAHPHLMLRFTVTGEAYERGQTDYLYHGDLFERLDEVCTMPSPKLINWPRMETPYSRLMKTDDRFLFVFGGFVTSALHSMMNFNSNEKLAKKILEAVDWSEGKDREMFKAIVGVELDELVERAKQYLRDLED